MREPFTWGGHDFHGGEWVLMDLYGTNHDPRLWHAPDRFDPDRFADETIDAFNLISPQDRGARDRDPRAEHDLTRHRHRSA
ncbi:cytochrome P450 [Methylorubrum pseudosasae]|nr:cytochrome P450 [Methylorubrum pseudosasae]